MTKSLSFKKTSLALAVALSLPVISAQAAESYKAEDVVVTASRVEQQLADVNMSVSVITNDQIEKNVGAQTIGDLLESSVPGVRIANDGAQGIDRVQIRGEDSFRTVVMIDGQRLAEHKTMSGAPLLIDPSQVERIEVIRGPSSVLYGSDAIGGVINIITKKGGNKPIQGSVSAGFNSSSSGKNASASIYGAANGWKYRISGAMQNHDNLDTPAGEMEHTQFNSKSANAFLSYDIDPNKTIGLTASYYDLDFEFADMSTPSFTGDVPKWTNSKIGAFAEFKNISDYWSRLRIDAYQQHNTKEMVNKPAGNAGPQILADNKTDTTAFSAQADWLLGDNHYLITGYDFSVDQLDADSGIFMQMLRPPKPPITRRTNTNYDGEQTRHSVFASVDSTFFNDLTFNYGVRYTWVKSEIDERDTINNIKVNSDHDSDSKAVFNFGATYRGFENLALRANWSQGYRTPILSELYVSTSMGGGSVAANPDLKPETSNNFELGARYSNNLVTIDASAFYTKAKDYITQSPVKNLAYDYQYDNVGEAETIGFELDARLHLNNFEPYTVLTLMRREFKDNGLTTTKTGTPKVTARYGVRYNRDYNGANFNLDAYAVTQSATENDNLDTSFDNYGNSNRVITSYGGATTLNLTGGVAFGPEQAYSLNAGFYNITDKLYQNNGSIYEPGRHFGINFNAKF